MDQQLKYKSYTTNLLEEHIGVNIYNTGFGNGFLDMKPETQNTHAHKR